MGEKSPNIEQYRNHWETDEMWEMRRTFIERYWGQYAVNRLLCLSQVFANMEYLQCSYSPKLMAEVRAMAADLSEERNQRRKAVVDALFAKKKGGGDEDASLRQDSKKLKSYSSPSLADKTPAAQVVDAEIAQKLRIFELLKAELTITPAGKTPMDTFNYACNRAKYTWNMEWNGAYCKLLVENVVVLEQYFWGDQLRAKQEACCKSAEVIQRVSHDVRRTKRTDQGGAGPGSVGSGGTVLELFTSSDQRLGWQGPDSWRFVPVQRMLTAVRDHLPVCGSASASKVNFYETLQKICADQGASFCIDRQRITGWTERCQVKICGVIIYDETSHVAPKQNQTQAFSDLSRKAIDRLFTASSGLTVSQSSNQDFVLSFTGTSVGSSKVIVSSSTSSSSEPSSSSLQHEALIRKLQMNMQTSSAELNPVQRIDVACSKAKCIPNVEFSGAGPFCCTVKVGNIVMAASSGASKKAAKTDAFAQFVSKLEMPYFSVRADQHNNGTMILFASRQPLTGQKDNGAAANTKNDANPCPSSDDLHANAEALSELVLFEFANHEDTPGHILNTSCQFNRMTMDYVDLPAGQVTHTGSDYEFRLALYINGVKISEGGGPRKEDARRDAAKRALGKLKHTQYTVVLKSSIDSTQETVLVGGSAGSPSEASAEAPVPETNIGRKMLEKMGWMGGGIGLHEQGIKEPISVQETWQRNGIGSNVNGAFRRTIAMLISDYARSDRQEDLVFPATISKEQRAHIHRMAHRFNLKSVSYGTGESRQLTLQKQRTPVQLIEYLRQVGGENGKYRLIPPS